MSLINQELTKNLGRIRLRIIPSTSISSSNLSSSIYPGQPIIDYNPSTKLGHLRVGTADADGSANGWTTSSIKIVPEDDTITESMLKSNSVSTDKIINGNVTVNKLNKNSVSTDKIIDGNVTKAKLGTDLINTKTVSFNKVSLSLTQAADHGFVIGLTEKQDTYIDFGGDVTGSGSFKVLNDNISLNLSIGSGKVKLSMVDRNQLLLTGSSNPTNSNKALLYFNTTTHTLWINTQRDATNTPNWVAVVGVWG